MRNRLDRPICLQGCLANSPLDCYSGLSIGYIHYATQIRCESGPCGRHGGMRVFN